MWPDLIVEGHVARHPLVGVVHSLVSAQIDLFIFAAPPEALHNDVIPPTAATIHAALDALVFRYGRELQAGQLATLIGVEDLRAAKLRDRLSHRVKEEVRGQRIGEPPGQHAATSGLWPIRRSASAPRPQVPLLPGFSTWSDCASAWSHAEAVGDGPPPLYETLSSGSQPH